MKGSRKLLISVIALVITLAMAVTSTYAWFTTNTYVSVSGFNVEVKTVSDEGLFIKLGEIVGMSYGTTITAGQIATAISANGGTMTNLEPLTTSDGTALKQADSVISGDSTVAAGADAESGMYAKFTLMFQSTKPGVIVLMGDKGEGLESTISTYGSDGGVFTAWDYDTGDGTVGITSAQLLADATNYQLGNLALPYASGTSVPIRAANAARVTFDSDNAIDDIVVWGPNAFNTAIQTGYYLNAYSWTVTLPTDYRSNVDVIDSVTLAAETAGEVTNTPTVLCTLQASGSVYVGTITVYIWIDGNDGSCINNISSDAFTVAMEFRRIDG